MTRFRQLLVALVATGVCAAQLQAQTTGTIRGRVFDAQLRSPLGDVTVSVAGQTVASDVAGVFEVTGVPAGSYNLQAIRLGYEDYEETITVAAGETTSIVIEMQPAPVGLEMLVATGYGVMQKRDLTGVVDVVQAESFNTGRVVSAVELIRGKVAGVQVTDANGGEPGGGMSIRIRGGTSVTSRNDPLYVIDGVPVGQGGMLSATPNPGGEGRNPLNFLNPEDVASITILKDASATAIYGSQGANGVVLIQTKSGRGIVQGARVSYRGNFSGSSVVGRADILNAAQFRDVVAEQHPEQLVYLADENTDWLKAIERTGFGQEHNVAVTGGSGRTSYRLSLGYLNQRGVLKASEHERLTLSVAYNGLLFNDRLSLQASLLGARMEDQFTPGAVLGLATNFAPTQPIYDPDSPYGGYYEWDDLLATNNPIGALNLISDEGTQYTSMGNLTAEYFLPRVDGLSATVRLGYGLTNAERRFFAPSINKNEIETGSNGTISRSNPTEFGYQFNSFLTYLRNWDRHSINLTGGYEFLGQRTDFPRFLAEQLSSDLLGPDGVPSAETERTWLDIEESRLASWFARANYTYRDRYLFTATIRTDGSSKFGEDNRWGTFPSAAFAWRISEEPFMDGFGSLSDLKLRLSWGKNGNQAFDSYQQYKRYTYGDAQTRVQFGDDFVATIRPSSVDPNIKWEETSSLNFGVDYGFWDNRLTGSIEYYSKKTDDLIFDVIVAGGTNLSNVVTTNVGSVENKGFEATVNAAIMQGVGDEFSWNANFNFAYNKNELTKINPFAGGGEQILAEPFISGGVGSTVLVLQPGYPVNSFLVYEHIRDENGNPIWEDVNEDGTINEQDIYVDQPTVWDSVAGEWVPDGVVNFDDRRPYKSPAPDWIIGHTSLMRWKKFDLSFTLTAHLGNYVYNNVASSTGFYDQLVDAARPSNVHSSVLKYGFETPQYFSDVYVEDASFLRLENIELGYTFQRTLNGVRVYAGAQNLFTITGYTGVDPTATDIGPAGSISGIDNNIYPRTRTFSAGLSVFF